MNFSFLIDNSLTSCQLTQTGLSQLDIAKNAVEYFVKKRLKMPETKYDTYHLLTTGKDKPDMIQSSWVHDPGHFFNTLKFIQPEFDSDLVQALRLSFTNLNKFRALNGADNLHGGRDCLKLDPGVVMLFTVCDDDRLLQHLEGLIQTKQFPNRWDQKLMVYLMQTSGTESSEPGSVQFQQRNLHLQEQAAFTLWSSITLLVGKGSCFQILSQEGLLLSLDDLATELQPSISLILNHLPEPISRPYRYDLIEKHIDRQELQTQKGQEYLQGTKRSLKNLIVKSYLGYNVHWASHRFKAAVNLTIYTKVFLPETLLIKDHEAQDVSNAFTEPQYPGIPNYHVDFTSFIKCPLPSQLPFQDVHIQDQTLVEYCQAICANIKKIHIRFPLFYLQPMYTIDSQLDEERQVPLFVGVLQFEQSTNQLQLRFYFPNFFVLDYLLNLVKANNFNQKLVEKDLTQYFKKIPNYYSPCIRRVFQELHIDNSLTNRGWAYWIDDGIYNNSIAQAKNIQNRAMMIRKQTDDQFQRLKLIHVQKRSLCCAILSENYEDVHETAMETPFRLAAVENLPFFRETKLVQQLFDYPPCKSSQPPIPQSGPASLRNHGIGEDELEYGWEPAFCGNPWKVFKKIYQDGVERKQPASEQYELSNEDLILTKVDHQKDQPHQRQMKNKRKGFITMKDMQQGCKRRPSEPLPKQQIEVIAIEEASTKSTHSNHENGHSQRKFYESSFEQRKDLNFTTHTYKYKYTQPLFNSKVHLDHADIYRLILESINQGHTQDQLEEFIRAMSLEDRDLLQQIQKRAMEIVSAHFGSSI